MTPLNSIPKITGDDLSALTSMKDEGKEAKQELGPALNRELEALTVYLRDQTGGALQTPPSKDVMAA